MSQTGATAGASAAASTKRRVNVAIPERWQRKFSEVRSAVKIDASGPSTVPMTSPRRHRLAVGCPPVDDDRAVDLREGLGCARGAGEHAPLAGDERRPDPVRRGRAARP